MRMRKKKNAAARLDACRELILEKPASPMISPSKALGMAGAPVYLEIGAGKGGFATQMAKRHGGVSYFAMERVSDCVVLAAELAKRCRDEGRDNLRFIIDGADSLAEWFAKGSVDRIFLNFSDPWSKKGYAKRRLTHRKYLAIYMNLLKDGGSLCFKTDNTGLFDFSIEEIEAVGLKCDALTRDLHSSEYAAENIMTEYESAFVAEGMKINMLRVTKPSGFTVPMPPTNVRRGENEYGN